VLGGGIGSFCRSPTGRTLEMDPNTHAFVLATALITSISFVVFALNLLALVLSHLLS
jgi:hypothetical protein